MSQENRDRLERKSYDCDRSNVEKGYPLVGLRMAIVHTIPGLKEGGCD